MAIEIVANESEHSSRDLSTSIWDILNKNMLCAMATSSGSVSHIHTAYFAFDNDLNLFFLSDPQTEHGRNIEENPQVAVAVYDSHQPWQEAKQGLQLFGSCSLASGKTGPTADYAYIKRFASYGSWLQLLTAAQKKGLTSKFYVVEVDSTKIFDEPRFGEEVFVTASVNRS